MCKQFCLKTLFLYANMLIVIASFPRNQTFCLKQIKISLIEIQQIWFENRFRNKKTKIMETNKLDYWAADLKMLKY